MFDTQSPAGFTGIDDPYEAPLNCEVRRLFLSHIRTHLQDFDLTCCFINIYVTPCKVVLEPIDGRCPTPEEMAAQLVSYLEERGILGAQQAKSYGS